MQGKNFKNFIKSILEVPKKTALFFIRIYQKTLSIDHSFWGKRMNVRVCIFYPSCSEYTYEAIEKHGLIRGSILGIWRILRCNPFNKGGVDNVPEKWTSLFKSSDKKR